MKMARYALLVMIVSIAVSSSAAAEEVESARPLSPLRGKALWQMVDTLYGDFAKCWAVPSFAIGKENLLLVPMPSIIKEAFRSDKVKMEQLPDGQRGMVNSAYGIAYFLFTILMSVALSSIFLWLGASLAGERKEEGNFMKALICSSFDRMIIFGLLIAVTFGLSRALNTEGLSGVMGSTVIPVLLVSVFFLISTWIVKLVYRTKWGKAFLIQVCARVAVLLVAVFILGFASAVSLTSAT